MNSKVTLAILLAVAACLVSSSDAWGWRSRQNSKQNLSTTKNSTWNSKRNVSTYPSTTVVTVRRVDEEHPYYQAFDIRSSIASVNGLKQSLREFFNQTSNVTRIVKNDHLLITRDVEVRLLNNRDYLEVWFQDSKAPTRAKTMYSLAKDARKVASWGGKSDKDKTGTKDRSKSKREKKNRRVSEDAEVEDDTQFDFDQF